MKERREEPTTIGYKEFKMRCLEALQVLCEQKSVFDQAINRINQNLQLAEQFKEDSDVKIKYLLHDTGEVSLEIVERKWGIDNLK